MKSVLIVGLFGVLVTLSYAAKSSLPLESLESRTEMARAQERGDKHGGGGGGQGGGGGGGGGGHGWGKGGGGQESQGGGQSGGGGWGKEESGGGGHQVVYHETNGHELFQGEEWMLLVPLVLIPLLVLGCWYFYGGSGKGGDEGWGWDRMGYSDNSVGGGGSTGGYQSGSYDTRSLVPADALDKATHQRIMDSVQQQQ
jgi:hypothetical protein